MHIFYSKIYNILHPPLLRFKSFLWVSWDLKVNLFWIATRYVVTVKSKKDCGNRQAIPML